MTEKDILDLIEQDPWMMAVLNIASELNLPDWLIGAGFVRNKVWDFLHGYNKPEVDTADIDLIYFDPKDTREETEKKYEQELAAKLQVNWSVKNQARMHLLHNDPPYASSSEALACWVETATCVAVKLDNHKLKLVTPYGISDLVQLKLKPSPANLIRNKEFLHRRLASKNWLIKWPKLKVED